MMMNEITQNEDKELALSERFFTQITLNGELERVE